MHIQLLTLVGTGGVGKTSLALRVASELLHEFPDGVHVVSLAPISNPTLVTSGIAQTLGLRATSDRLLLDLLKEFLRSKQLLLVLDNFEQVTSVATLLAELIADSPLIKLLVTSRGKIASSRGTPIPSYAPSLARLEAACNYPGSLAVCGSRSIH